MAQSEFPTIEFDGYERSLAVLDPPLECGLPDFSDRHEVGLPTDLTPIDMSWAVVSTKDQTSTSSCVGQASAGAAETSRRLLGLKPMTFSPWFTYAQINGGRDGGAIISNALMAMRDKGMAPESMVPYGTIQAARIEKEVYARAMSYQLDKAFRCMSYDAILTAMARGFPVVFGIMVGKNFTGIDNQGYAGIPTKTNVLGGHALYGVALRVSPRNSKDLDVLCKNSWGKGYGTNGTAWLERRHFDMRVDAFAVQALEYDPDDSEDDLPTG